MFQAVKLQFSAKLNEYPIQGGTWYLKLRNPDPLPHIKLGRYLRFDWKDVLVWLERRKTG